MDKFDYGYCFFTAIIFLVIAIEHIVFVSTDWIVLYGRFEFPEWLSVIVILFSLYFAMRGFRAANYHR